MSDVRVVLITAPDSACAEAIARALVEERLAACVNVVPGVRSYYRWEGAVQADEELFRLAADDSLRDPEVLEAEVVRMVDDQRADR